MTTTSNSPERLYIGGLDPPRLTVSALLKRLLPDVQDHQVAVSNIKQGHTHCHLDAVSLSEGHTALEIVSKLYNNIKWMGCRIRVEPAKPHFLERLASEINERRQQQQEKMSSPSSSQPTRNPIPRHLKVRRGHGEVAYRVDTKPCQVSDWDGFKRIRDKLRRRQAETNRAVRMRFDQDEDDSMQADMQSTTTSSSTSSLSEQNNATYVWSDDDDDDSSVEMAKRPDHASAVGLPGDTGQQVLPGKSSYIWSDDDDDDSLSDDEQERATMTEGGSQDVDIPSRDDTSSNNSKEEISNDLRGDVQSNLDILASIFPDLCDSKPVAIPENLQEAKAEEDARGWNSQGQMLRFDPSKQTAKKFILDKIDVKETSNETTDEVNLPVQDPLQAEKDDVSTMENIKATSDHIYQEKSLEKVFRESREQVVETSKDQVFSFGFQLDSAPPQQDVEKQNATASFSFEFPIPATASREAGHSIGESSESESGPTNKKFQRLAPFFPKVDIELYMDFFFKFGDGARILENLQEYRNDPKAQEDWDRQRRILTEDWKRKRKQAQHSRKKARKF